MQHNANAKSESSMTSPPSPVELAVIVPTYRESRNVAELVRRVDLALKGYDFEIIFVDDDSPDGTSLIARQIGRTDPRIRCLRRVGRRGLAGACVEGMLSTNATVVAVMDGDLQHDETVLPDMLEKIRAGHDLVIASRNIDGGSKDEGLSPFRRQISDLGRLLANHVMKAELTDPMSGFFMIRRELIEEIAPSLSTTGFKILADIAATLPKKPMVAEVPYIFKERQQGHSKLDAKVALDYLGFILNKLSGGIIPLRFIFFVLVGLSGVIVHLIALKGLLVLGYSFTIAQTIATLIAMTSNYFVNNFITYRDARRKGWKLLSGLIIFQGICSIGLLANVGVARWVYEEMPTWWLAGLSGAMMAAVWNYSVSALLVWRR